MSVALPADDSLESISVALPADEMRWDLEPVPDDRYISDLKMAVDITIESRACRETVQVLLGLIADLQKRFENLQGANRELGRARYDIHR